jgi:hypothetical protein
MRCWWLFGFGKDYIYASDKIFNSRRIALLKNSSLIKSVTGISLKRQDNLLLAGICNKPIFYKDLMFAFHHRYRIN